MNDLAAISLKLAFYLPLAILGSRWASRSSACCARTLPPRLLGGAGLVAGLVLLPQRDIHGGACLIGALLAALLLALAGPCLTTSERNA